MIDLWLRSGTAGIILIPFVLLFAIAAGIVWLTHLSPARRFFASCVGIVGPFFGSVALLFSLFAAFLANDVQHQAGLAQVAVNREADGIRTILRLSEALGEAGSPLEAAIVAYAQTVLETEWPAMREGRLASVNLDSLRRVIAAALAPSLATAIGPAAHQAIVDSLVDIRQARRDRIDSADRQSALFNWLATLILGVLTQIAVAVVQLDKLRPQALALVVFTAAFAATVALIGLGERPFTGHQIDDDPLRSALRSATQ
jgi:hypothetical protein